MLSLGLFVVAATTGALIAMGRRVGGVGLPFAAIAAPVLRRTTTTSDLSLVTAGVMLHVLITLFWSAVFVRLVRGGWRSTVAALVVAIAAHGATWLAAWVSGKGLASVLPLGDRIVLGVIFAGALVVGIRLAFSHMREDVAFR